MSAIKVENVDNCLLRVTWRDRLLFDYIYRPDTKAVYCPRPYLHPLRNLVGDIVTNLRPSDHPWHQGLSMTLTDVNGMNFWGGGTYRREAGAYGDYNNIGSQQHRAWHELAADEGGANLVEELHWMGPDGSHVLTEQRTLRVQDVDEPAGFWRLIWQSEFVSHLGEPLRINSYCSGEGLAGSGYSGLLMRLSRGFNPVPAYVVSPDQRWTDYHDGAEEITDIETINGRKGSRLAYHGLFDTSLHGTVLLLEDITEKSRYAHHWFCRPGMPCLAWATSFHDPLVIPAGEPFAFKHALGVGAGFWSREDVAERWISQGES